jgi:hypothetical protein
VIRGGEPGAEPIIVGEIVLPRHGFTATNDLI